MLKKILPIVGLALMLLCLLVLGIVIALPILTDGRTSWREASGAIVGAYCCTCATFPLVAVGLGLLLWNKKPPQPK